MAKYIVIDGLPTRRHGIAPVDSLGRRGAQQPAGVCPHGCRRCSQGLHARLRPAAAGAGRAEAPASRAGPRPGCARRPQGSATDFAGPPRAATCRPSLAESWKQPFAPARRAGRKPAPGSAASSRSSALIWIHPGARSAVILRSASDEESRSSSGVQSRLRARSLAALGMTDSRGMALFRPARNRSRAARSASRPTRLRVRPAPGPALDLV